MRLFFAIIIILAAFGIAKRENGKWYDYIAIAILSILVCIGIYLV